ncbi:MAG: Do family serine endopeptidase [Planctomycetes bacterium]|nr:Do family serine endopeptidase [Planctomycetota bacterium]
MRQAGLRSRTAGLIAVSVIAGSLISWTLITRVGQGQQNSPSAADIQAVEQAKGLSRAFRSAAKQVLPTVVEVRTVVKPRPAGDSPTRENPFRGSPLEDFFGDQGPNFRFHGMPDAPRPGLGSGVIIDASGIVLTNNHVVKDADEVKVRLGDGREFDAVEIKTDERSDLAVLRIEAKDSLPAARLGDSDELEIGDWVLAIGNPFELEQTVSAGIISGKRRNLGSVQRATFLQTDAAINPGNSGGPLVNLDGEVVGINTAIFSRTGGNQGIGFAIPANLAKWITPQLIERGEVARAYMGVSIVDIDTELAGRLDVPLGAGVVVATIGEGSPAEEAGLEEDDVIVSFDGHRIRTAPDLQELVERSAADSRHELKILRGGEPQMLPVVVKTMTKDFEAAMQRSRFGGRMGTSEFYQDRQLGIAVIDMTKAFSERLGYRGLNGVLIRDVDAGRIAAQAGLRGGMLITHVGDNPVQNVAEYEEAVKGESLKAGITLEVHSDRGKQTIKLQKS